jgi:hypothetical protein
MEKPTSQYTIHNNTTHEGAQTWTPPKENNAKWREFYSQINTF